MNKNQLHKVLLTEEEYDLIETIRNYNRSFPDAWPEMVYSLERMLQDMLRQPYE